MFHAVELKLKFYENKITSPAPQIEQIYRKSNNNVVSHDQYVIYYITLFHYYFILFYNCVTVEC